MRRTEPFTCLVPRRLSFDENVRAKEGGKVPSVPFPWSLAVHHQSFVSRSPLPCEKRSAWGGGWPFIIFKDLIFVFKTFSRSEKLAVFKEFNTPYEPWQCNWTFAYLLKEISFSLWKSFATEDNHVNKIAPTVYKPANRRRISGGRFFSPEKFFSTGETRN